MDAQVKARWVENLRSGKYVQSGGGMHKTVDGAHKYCCIGVLAETLGLQCSPEVGIAPLSDGYNDTVYYRYKPTTGEPQQGGSLPSCELEAIGLDDHIQSRLIRMNDETKMSFVEIAAYIEESL